MINAAQGIWVPQLVFSNTDEKINTKNDEKTFAVARYRELFFEADICLIRVPKPLVRVPKLLVRVPNPLVRVPNPLVRVPNPLAH